MNQPPGKCGLSRQQGLQDPSQQLDEQGYDGTLISGQRRNKGSLSPERRQRLDEIGFVWDARLPPTTDD